MKFVLAAIIENEGRATAVELTEWYQGGNQTDSNRRSMKRTLRQLADRGDLHLSKNANGQVIATLTEHGVSMAMYYGLDRALKIKRASQRFWPELYGPSRSAAGP